MTTDVYRESDQLSSAHVLTSSRELWERLVKEQSLSALKGAPVSEFVEYGDEDTAPEGICVLAHEDAFADWELDSRDTFEVTLDDVQGTVRFGVMPNSTCAITLLELSPELRVRTPASRHKVATEIHEFTIELLQAETPLEQLEFKADVLHDAARRCADFADRLANYSELDKSVFELSASVRRRQGEFSIKAKR